MASKGVSTAGSKVGWAKGTDDKTVPKSFTKIPEVKEVPELNPEPATLETTTLEETEYKTYTSGLKDLGGAIALTCNFTEEMIMCLKFLRILFLHLLRNGLQKV